MSSPRLWTQRATFIVAAAAALSLSLSPSVLHAKPPAPAAPPPAASAQPAAPDSPGADLQSQAAERKKSGDQAMEALRYADALAAYNDAYAITKDTALLYNMGRALEALNRFPEALDKLTSFEANASPELKARVPRLPKLIADLRERVSTLDIRTNIEGARILVRNSVVGRSPLAEPLKLVAGPADIEIDAEGYFTAKKTVELKGGTGQTVSLDLFSRATTGVLTVRASASPAEVLVDGRRIGVAPVELNVPKGTHRITVRHADFRVFETSTVVAAGGTKAVTATLQSKSIVTKWWFWTGIGAIAAASVAVAIVSVTERAPDAGTIAPGQLSTKTMPMQVGAALFHF